VVGIADVEHLKLNDKARPGDLIYLTKPLGAGIMSTAIRKNTLFPDDEAVMIKYLGLPNKLGALLGPSAFVNCMTDITGFGLIGHLSEICSASKVSARINMNNVKVFTNLEEYIEMGIITNGGKTNWENYRCNVNGIGDMTAAILSDPQSNGGLLITVDPQFREEFEEILSRNHLSEFVDPIGEIVTSQELLLDIVE
jgi:selenide, water dikinase